MPTERPQPTVLPKDWKPVVLNKDELDDINGIMLSLNAARDMRDRPQPELDDMTPVQYYESNRKKDLSYIPPKLNKGDVRIVNGLTREKDTTLLSTVLNMNLEPDITGFDSDNLMVAELGDNMGDMVKKSREIEDYDRKRPIIYREMIAQGDVFVQETFVEDFRNMPITDLDWDPKVNGVSDFSMQERLKRLFSGCAVRMINQKKIYVGDIRKEYIQDQDVVAVMNIYSRQEAFSRYAFWERWANVPTTIDTTQFFALDGSLYKSWNLVRLANQDQVAEIMVYRPKLNRFQILLNGVPMLPHNMPMTYMFPSGEVPIAQGKLEPISDFYLSKSQPSKVKIDQEVLDETTRLMIDGMRQSRKPPMGNKGKKVYASGIFTAGKITPDVKPGDLFSILPPEALGIKPSEFSFYQLIKQSINDKTVNDSYAGQEPSGGDGTPTATQIDTEKEQQALKLGSALDGFVNLERRMTWLRIYDIMENWTQPLDSNWDDDAKSFKAVYRQFSMHTTVEDGQKGIKMFRFGTDKYPEMKDHQKEEEKLTDKYNMPVRIVYLDPEILRAMKYTWFILINPTPRSNDKLTQLMFIQNLNEAISIFGPDALNIEYLKQRFAILINEDYNKYFKKADIMAMINAGMYGSPVVNAAGGGAPTGGPQAAVRTPAAKPVTPAMATPANGPMRAGMR